MKLLYCSVHEMLYDEGICRWDECSFKVIEGIGRADIFKKVEVVESECPTCKEILEPLRRM